MNEAREGGTVRPEGGEGALSFVFVRHGETEFNLRGLLAGSTDVALTARGTQQAAAAAAALAAEPVRRVFTSPLRRARDTARAIAARHGVAPEIVQDLRERNWGTLEGRTFPADLYHPHPPGGEAMGAYLDRLRAAMACILPFAGAPGVVVVAHAGVFDGLCRVLAGLTAPPLIANAAPVWFGAVPGEPGRWRVLPLDPAALVAPGAAAVAGCAR